MKEKSDRARPWKGTEMTRCARGQTPATSCLLIHVGHRRSQLALSHGPPPPDCRIGLLLYVRTRGFLTSTSCVPGVSLYGQNDQYDTCFFASRLQNIPALSAPTGDTKQGAPARKKRKKKGKMLPLAAAP